MRNALSMAASFLAALVKGRKRTDKPYPMRRPVDEILNVGYKFAHGPHDVKDLAQPSKDAA